MFGPEEPITRSRIITERNYVVMAAMAVAGALTLTIISAVFVANPGAILPCPAQFQFRAAVNRWRITYDNVEKLTGTAQIWFTIFKDTYVVDPSYMMITDLTTFGSVDIPGHKRNQTVIMLYRNCNNQKPTKFYLHEFEKMQGSIWQLVLSLASLALFLSSSALFAVSCVFAATLRQQKRMRDSLLRSRVPEPVGASVFTYFDPSLLNDDLEEIGKEFDELDNMDDIRLEEV